jgi:hypothetical protein
MPSKKIPTSIGLDPDIREYLKQKKIETGLSRTWIINTLLRERMAKEKAKTVHPFNPDQLILKEL